MKTGLHLLLIGLLALTGEAFAQKPTGGNPLYAQKIDVSEEQYIMLKIEGINCLIHRTSDKDVRIELYAGEPGDKKGTLQAEFSANYDFTVHKKGNSIEALVGLKPGVDKPEKLNKWLVVYLPQNKRIHLKSADKFSFGPSFPENMHGSYSGTANFGPVEGTEHTH